MAGTARNRAANPAEQSVDMEKREQAMRLIQQLAGNAGQYVPLLKQLATIGVEPKVMDVMLGDEPTECIVLPVSELMAKEWKYMNNIQNQENS